MKLPVSANGDLVITGELVAELIAEPGDECFVELDEAGTRITVTRMDPRVARAYGSLEVEGDTDKLIDEMRGREPSASTEPTGTQAHSTKR